MSPSEKLNTSVGRPGEPEPRTFSRLYQTLIDPVNELKYLMSKFRDLEALSNDYRRTVLRSLCSKDVITQALKTNLPIEAVIPMNLVTDDNSSIVFLGKNNHESPSQGRNIKDLIEHRNNHKIPLEKVRSIPKGFNLTNQINENDEINLLALWERFGWNRVQIRNFIQMMRSNQDDLWFSGVRDSNSKKLVAASTAEAMQFSGIKYIETTEYSTLDGYENLGLCTASVAGLVAQVLNAQHILPTVITAEFNTSSTSAAIGASAGFVIPKTDGVSQILSYNVAVVDGASANPVFINDHQTDRGIPFRYLKDFALAVLPRENIDRLYSQVEIKQIINLYDPQ